MNPAGKLWILPASKQGIRARCSHSKEKLCILFCLARSYEINPACAFAHCFVKISTYLVFCSMQVSYIREKIEGTVLYLAGIYA
jgi:hypothetical protein